MSAPLLEPLPMSHFQDFFVKFEMRRSPEVMFAEWKAQTLGHPLSELSRRYKAIAIAAGVTVASVRNAFNPNPERRQQVSAEVRQSLALMAQFLGLPTFPPPPGKRNGSIALLTDFEILSVRFHFELMRSLANEASRHALALSLHCCPHAGMVDVIRSLQVRHHPDAYILVRLTPTRSALDLLRDINIPVVLIHADVLQYGPPVLAHVVPDQSDVPAGIGLWLDVLERELGRRARQVVVVAVQDEEPRPCDWAPLEPGKASIRNQRKLLIMDALRRHGAEPSMAVVKDYSQHSALGPFQENPEADGFVCLSDSLAVGVKQHFIVAEREWRGRILGFDNTLLAQEEGLSSFDQSRSESARLALEALTRFFDQPTSDGSVVAWPAPELASVKVALKLRPASAAPDPPVLGRRALPAKSPA